MAFAQIGLDNALGLLVTSRGVPRAISRALVEHDHARSASETITSMMCSTMTSVMPVPWMCAHQFDGRADLGGVRPAMASSSSRTLGSDASARAISSRLRPGVPRLFAGASATGAEANAVDYIGAPWRRHGRVAVAQESADHHVVEHRHGLECQRHLEGAGDAEGGALPRAASRVTSRPLKCTVPDVG